MILPRGFDYRRGFLEVERADALLDRIRRSADWRQYPIRLFGRKMKQPRLTAWCSDPGIRYRYSGTTLEPSPWLSCLSGLREELSAACGAAFNSVLINAYRDGNDAMGWHADDEPELGPQPVIASLSLGQERTFRVRPRGGGRSFGLLLEHGSLLVMSGRSQAEWQHALPRSKRPMDWRINLTFRRVKGPQRPE